MNNSNKSAGHCCKNDEIQVMHENTSSLHQDKASLCLLGKVIVTWSGNEESWLTDEGYVFVYINNTTNWSRSTSKGEPCRFYTFLLIIMCKNDLTTRLLPLPVLLLHSSSGYCIYCIFCCCCTQTVNVTSLSVHSSHIAGGLTCTPG